MALNNNHKVKTGCRIKRRYTMRSLNIFLLILSLCFLSIGAGCRGTASTVSPVFYIDPDVDLSFIKRVAVLPLDNLSSEKAAGEIVRQIMISELLASGLVDVVVPGEVVSALNSLKIKSISSLNAEHIKSIGKALKVEAVVMGAVERYGYTRAGNVSAPEVTITLMMADTSTGSIIWSVTKMGGGASFMARHFGARSKTLSETVLSVVRDAINTFTGY
jgi:hypothetical protein